MVKPVTILPGDCREVMRQLADGCVDAIVTDPPYALVSIVKRFGKEGSAEAKSDGPTGVYARASAGFMGKQWDTGEAAFSAEFWAEAMRVLKPGGHVVAFSGTRTYHHMATAIETAGFSMRDAILNMLASDKPVRRFIDSLNDEQLRAFALCIEESQFGGLLGWVYGSGFPKSHDVSKAIDKAAGYWRGRAGEVIERTIGQVAKGTEYERTDKGDPITAAAAAWEGWGTALKPSWEPIVLARKPLDGTVAANVLQHGTGALNIAACRIARDEPAKHIRRSAKPDRDDGYRMDGLRPTEGVYIAGGGWPGNVAHDGSDEVHEAFARFGDHKGGGSISKRSAPKTSGIYGAFKGDDDRWAGYGDTGTAARFFYSAKADREDRWGSKHPTVKPVDLIRWLIRLITPPGGVVLDPFAGSGTTGVAAMAEGMRAVLIEREPEYLADIRERIDYYSRPLEGRHRVSALNRNKPKPKDELPLWAAAPADGGDDAEG